MTARTRITHVDDRERDDQQPKVTPWMLTVAETMCARRLHAEYTGAAGTYDPFNRGRVREALFDAIRTWHTVGSWPPTPSHLEVEEQRVLEHAIRWYGQLFDRDAAVEIPITDPTELPRRGVRLGGLVDFGVVHTDGTRELRQLALGGHPPEQPADLPATRLAVLRLAQTRWIEDERVRLTWTDLLSGVQRESWLQVPDNLTDLADWLDERLELVDARIATPSELPGRDCGTCRFVPRCPAHGVRGSMQTRAGDRFPGVLALSPTRLDAWNRCRRELGNRMLAVPASDAEGATSHGLYLHSLLRLVHEHGSCHDHDHVASVLATHGADARVADEVRRHAARCPPDAVALGHELEWARARPEPPVFIATARLDAVWIRDGRVLEIRDYKTGNLAVDATADDPRAQLQAWVAAPAARGLQLRIRYEHLSSEVDDDPVPWEPDDEDLQRIEEQLCETVALMHAERDWRGVADETICRHCRYRSICPDSAAPGEPYWPILDS